MTFKPQKELHRSPHGLQKLSRVHMVRYKQKIHADTLQGCSGSELATNNNQN